jgi:hypothetical protein
MSIPVPPRQIIADGFQSWKDSMAFELQPELTGSVEEPIVIYEPLRTHRDVPAWIHAGLAGIEHLIAPESYPPSSLVPSLDPELDYLGFASGVAEFAGPSHSPGEVVPDPLNLHPGARELDSHEGRKDAPTEPSPLSDPDVSRYQVLGGESMGSLLSGDSLTGSETHQE